MMGEHNTDDQTAAVHPVLQRQPGTAAFHNCGDDRKSQPTSFGAGIGGAVERLQHPVDLGFWDAKAGIADVYGYTNVESGFRAVGLPDEETYTGTFLWMNADEIVEHMRVVLLDRLSKVDAGVVDRTADKYA